MHSRTLLALERIKQADWFAKVGEPAMGGARVLSSWAEAMQVGCSFESESFTLEADNQYSERVCARDVKRFNQWNDICDEVKEKMMPLVRTKCEALVRQNQLEGQSWVDQRFGRRKRQALEALIDTVNWDIFHACMELEYADVYPPGFFANQVYWYSRGHFPCGAEGLSTSEDNVGRLVFADDFYPAGYYDKIARWYEAGFGDWQGQIPHGKMIVY
jgi:hypothetical protein